MNEPTQQALRAMFGYDPQTGAMTWLPRPDDERWTKRYAGKEAGSLNCRGYRLTTINNRKHPVHRLVWIWMHGDIGDKHIDHINGDKSDNRIANLRAVTKLENNRNTSMPRHNTTGTVGVYHCARYGTWEASITVNQRRMNLGTYKTMAEAIAARKAAEKIYGFHQNHGRKPINLSREAA